MSLNKEISRMFRKELTFKFFNKSFNSHKNECLFAAIFLKK